MEPRNRKEMEEELAILRIDVDRGEELLQGAILDRQRLKDELEKVKQELLESKHRELDTALGISTPELSSVTPRLSPFGTVPETPANTEVTSFTRERCIRNNGPAGTTLKGKGTEEPAKEDTATSVTNLKKPNICPDRFNGKVPWKDYKAHFMACYVANGWDDEAAKVFLAASLQGPALSVLGCQTEGKRYSFKDLIQSLDQRFGPGEQAEYHLMELRHRRQGEKETLQELGQKVKELSALAYPEFSEEGRDRLARGHFMDAVANRAIREAIFRAKPTTLEDSIKAALAAESYYKVEELRAAEKMKKYARMLEKEQPVEPTGEVQVNKAVIDRAVQQIISRFGEEAPGWSKETARPFGYRKASSEDVCYNCRRKGHFARHCKEPRYRRPRVSGNDMQSTQRPVSRLEKDKGHENQNETTLKERGESVDWDVRTHQAAHDRH